MLQILAAQAESGNSSWAGFLLVMCLMALMVIGATWQVSSPSLRAMMVVALAALVAALLAIA